MASMKQQQAWWALVKDEDSYAPTGQRLKDWLFGGAHIPVSNALFDVEDSKLTVVSDLFGDDACVSRLTNNAEPARTFFNYDQGTNTIPNIEGFEARSTRPLVSAGGNLLELYGEDVEGGAGLGEERLATLLAEPSGSDLLIAGAFDSFGDTNYTEAWGEVDVVVKDLPDVSAGPRDPGGEYGQPAKQHISTVCISQHYAASTGACSSSCTGEQ